MRPGLPISSVRRRVGLLKWTGDVTIALNRLPGSYSTIYLLSTLDQSSLAAAEEEGLIRPELRRAELIAWRKAKEAPGDSRAALRAQRERLIKERIRLDAELRRIEGELEGRGE